MAEPAAAGYISRRSAKVILTAAATVGLAAHAQQAGDPCDAAGFNGKACQTAVRHSGFCDGGSWVAMTYDQRYPYYYDRYLSYLAGGGATTPVPDVKCRRPSHGFARGGFGAMGAHYRAGG